MTTLVLVPSPLEGPFVWSHVAAELRRRGVQAIVPSLHLSDDAEVPYWQQHVDMVKSAIEAAQPVGQLVPVGHSGAGVLLPVIRQILERPVAGYIFVDAGLPKDGTSRFDSMSAEDVASFERRVVDGHIATFTDRQLQGLIPDAEDRSRFVTDLRPLPLAVYQEPLPVFAGWPDAPCGYLYFSPGYEDSAHEAGALGWPVFRMSSGHFNMLVDPGGVTAALLAVTEQWSL